MNLMQNPEKKSSLLLNEAAMKLQKVVQIVIISLFVVYFFWEVYWYSQVGLSFIKWHTHIAFFIYMFVAIYFVLKILKVKKEFIFLIFLFFLGLELTEVVLVMSGLNKTRFEKQYGFYHPSNRTQSRNNYYWIDDPGTIKHLRAVDGEFYYTRKINSFGYSDSEWAKKKFDEFRIICLGDSFTEGDGAHVDSNYVSQLRTELSKHNLKNVTVFNAGKCGSDPFFSFINYKDILSKLKPDLIIQTISSQDIDQDINERGGFERFQKNYTLSYRKKSKTIEFLYAISYTTRVFLQLYGYNELIQYQDNFEENYKYDEIKIKKLFDQFQHLTHKNNAQLLVVFLPQRDEVETETYLPYLQTLKNSIATQKIKNIDLLPFYLSEIKKARNQVEKYYWEKDAHHNAKGYKLMASGIFQGINELIASKNPNFHLQNDDIHE